jgi:glycine/D-amino acid oxidase-like deaminating enzyme
MKRHVVILGAGFGGLELSTLLSEQLADELEVTLIDQHDAFILGFSKLDILFRHQTRDEVRLPYRRLAKRGAVFRQETVRSIDPQRRRVGTNEATYDADFLVVAPGADYDLTATPGFVEGGFEYYSVAGAERLRDELPRFRGGKVLSWPSCQFLSSVRPPRTRESCYCTTTWLGEGSATRPSCMWSCPSRLPSRYHRRHRKHWSERWQRAASTTSASSRLRHRPCRQGGAFQRP